ncbi:MAG TPA: STAS domain-containing protein [Candidatus Tyrphobacter sp.]
MTKNAKHAPRKKRNAVTLAFHPNDPSLQKTVLGHVAAGASEVVLELDHLEALDVPALRVLIALLRRTREAGGTLALRTAKPHIRRTLAVTALDRLFAVRSSAEAAA